MFIVGNEICKQKNLKNKGKQEDDLLKNYIRIQ